ncbi:DNA internalization-related competence protein ComEC/Rec2 [Marinobacter salinus]|uniref:DNA internalization-related competence protein ComEC/Rec2 n=1 Tax=Marinobacter salinus TaxID=1874317 RepID=UPI0009F22E02|nr:DNA internalization-related competence protein ComEC/Rec2 [Marinobacter salinus]
MPLVGRGSAVSGVFAFSCGVILLYRLSVLPPPEWIAGCFLTAFYMALRCRSSLLRRIAVLCLGLCMGVGWASWHAGSRLSERLPGQYEGQKLAVSGYLCDIPSEGSFGSLRFSLCVTDWHGLSEKADDSDSLPALLRLSWYGHESSPLPARRLQLDVVLKRPHGTLNPAGFRYEDWLFRNGYRATGSVREVRSDPGVHCGWHCQYQKAHAALVSWVDHQFSGAEYFPFVASLLVGYRGHMSQPEWDVLTATGTIHLVAISGLHLGLIAFGAGFACRQILLSAPPEKLSEGARRRAVFVTVTACCILYALAAGWTVPTRRALIMVAVGGWSVLLARQASVWQSLVLALGAVLLLDPFAPLDQGFWLSFGAVAVLIFVFAGTLGGSGWFRGLLLAQVAVFAGLWPVLQVFGQEQPVVGAVANLLAIPWVSLVVMPVLVTGGLVTALVPAMSDFFIPLFDGVIGILWRILAGLADFDVVVISATLAEVSVLAVLALCLIYFPLKRFRLIAMAMIFFWSFLSGPRGLEKNPMVSAPEVSVWDVGQGMSVLLRHGQRVLLYDTGPALPGVFSAVDSTILPNLKALGVRRIDTLVVSHADSDHSGGLALLARSIEIGRIVAGEPGATQEALPADSDLPINRCVNFSEALGELTVSYWQAPGAVEGNDASCVVTIWHRPSGTEWILAGDITKKVEAAHLEAFAGSDRPDAIRMRVLLAPHHGSKTSSSADWINALKPDAVIYSAGYQHRYGHPHPDIVARYRKAGVRQFNTACSGLLSMDIEANRLKMKEMRDRSPFWIGGEGLARDECGIP